MIPEFDKLTPLQARVWAAALYWTRVLNRCFTIQQFCSNNNFKLNRHSREAMAMIVASGAIKKQRALCPDSKWRTFYVIPNCEHPMLAYFRAESPK